MSERAKRAAADFWRGWTAGGDGTDNRLERAFDEYADEALEGQREALAKLVVKIQGALGIPPMVQHIISGSDGIAGAVDVMLARLKFIKCKAAAFTDTGDSAESILEQIAKL